MRRGSLLGVLTLDLAACRYEVGVHPGRFTAATIEYDTGIR